MFLALVVGFWYNVREAAKRIRRNLDCSKPSSVAYCTEIMWYVKLERGRSEIKYMKINYIIIQSLRIVRWLAIAFSILGLLVFGPQGDVLGAILFTVPALVAVWASRDWQKRSKWLGTSAFVMLLCGFAVFGQTAKGKAAYAAEQMDEKRTQKQEAVAERKQRLAEREQDRQQQLISARAAKEQAAQQVNQSEAQKSLDAENAMDEQNSHDAGLNNLPPPPKIGSACGPPAKTNPDGTISVSARRLYYDYVTTGPAANEKYQFHTLKVTGTFLDWENDDDGDSDNNGDHVYLIYLVSGNTWIDNDPQANTTHVYSISCSFDGTVPKAFTHRIIKARDNTSTIVSVICTCTCDDPTTTDPMLKLNCSSIKIVNNIH